MSVAHRFVKPISFKELLELVPKCGLELVDDEKNNSHSQCIRDAETNNYMWIEADKEGNDVSVTRFGGNNQDPIIDKLELGTGLKILSELDRNF